MRTAIDTSDAPVLVVTGSSSVGVADHLHDVLDERSATWHVDGVACRPGHPQALARTADGRWVVGLPGNPYAGLVAALTLLEPLLSTLAGHRRRPLPVAPVSGTAGLYPGGCRIVPVETVDGGARIVPGARSGSLRAAAAADALAVLDAGWATGAAAPLLRLPDLGPTASTRSGGHYGLHLPGRHCAEHAPEASWWQNPGGGLRVR
ncbi:hypothetical protein GCM10027610_059730 [Dactylosporangium cerinum]